MEAGDLAFTAAKEVAEDLAGTAAKVIAEDLAIIAMYNLKNWKYKAI